MASFIDLATAKHLLTLATNLVEAATPLSRVKQLLKQFPAVSQDFKKLLCVWMGFEPDDSKLSDDEFLAKNTSALSTQHKPWVQIIIWLVQQLKKSKGKPEYDTSMAFLLESGNIDVLTKHIVDKHIKTEDISLHEGIFAAKRAHEGIETDLREDKLIDQAYKKLEAKKPPFQGPIVYKYDDGYTIQDLNTKALLVDETVYMGDICVGKDEYGWPQKVKSGTDKVYSLRTQDGFPVINISFYTRNKRINEIVKYGNNTDLGKEDIAHIVEAHEKGIFKIDLFDENNLNWFKTEFGKKYDSPEGLESLLKEDNYFAVFHTDKGKDWLYGTPEGTAFLKSQDFAEALLSGSGDNLITHLGYEWLDSLNAGQKFLESQKMKQVLLAEGGETSI